MTLREAIKERVEAYTVLNVAYWSLWQYSINLCLVAAWLFILDKLAGR